jgi:hypothetical protein
MLPLLEGCGKPDGGRTQNSIKFKSDRQNCMHRNEPDLHVNRSTCCATLVRSKEEASFNETETGSSGLEAPSLATIRMLNPFPDTAVVPLKTSRTGRFRVVPGQFSHDEGKKHSASLSISLLQQKHVCMVKSANERPFSRHQALTTQM